MQKFKVIAFANTLAVIDLFLHPIFHLWVAVSPQSYEWLMNLFVAGLKLEVTEFDTNLSHILAGTVVEAGAFWLLGASIAIIYNKFAR